MKKLNFYFILILIGSSLNICVSQTETSMQDIQDKVTAYTNQLQQNSYEVINTTIEQVTKGGTKSFTKYLESSSEYYVVVFGDDSIDKLTLDINNGTPSELNYNSEAMHANAAISIINSGGNSNCKFTVKNIKYNGGNVSGYFAVIVYRKNQ